MNTHLLLTTSGAFGIFFHIMPRMATFLNLLDNWCYKRTLRKTSSFPNLFRM
uniref:Uncharacterized protein n=1 Tax=Arundo donax TaxID=35708 RepID=A0A0A8XWP9_ARUDO